MNLINFSKMWRNGDKSNSFGNYLIASFVSIAIIGNEIVVSWTFLSYGGNHVTCCLENLAELKLQRYFNDSPRQVAEGLTILRYHRGFRNEELITQKTLIQHEFAQFSRFWAETSQVRQWLFKTGQGWVDNFMLHWGLRNKGLISQKGKVSSIYIRTVFKIQSWNFTCTSMTPQDRSWRGWRGIINEKFITHHSAKRRVCIYI